MSFKTHELRSCPETQEALASRYSNATARNFLAFPSVPTVFLSHPNATSAAFDDRNTAFDATANSSTPSDKLISSRSFPKNMNSNPPRRDVVKLAGAASAAVGPFIQ